jgi:hypothetical protein
MADNSDQALSALQDIKTLVCMSNVAMKRGVELIQFIDGLIAELKQEKPDAKPDAA